MVTEENLKQVCLTDLEKEFQTIKEMEWRELILIEMFCRSLGVTKNVKPFCLTPVKVNGNSAQEFGTAVRTEAGRKERLNSSLPEETNVPLKSTAPLKDTSTAHVVVKNDNSSKNSSDTNDKPSTNFQLPTTKICESGNNRIQDDKIRLAAVLKCKLLKQCFDGVGKDVTNSTSAKLPDDVQTVYLSEDVTAIDQTIDVNIYKKLNSVGWFIGIHISEKSSPYCCKSLTMPAELTNSSLELITSFDRVTAVKLYNVFENGVKTDLECDLIKLQGMEWLQANSTIRVPLKYCMHDKLFVPLMPSTRSSQPTNSPNLPFPALPNNVNSQMAEGDSLINRLSSFSSPSPSGATANDSSACDNSNTTSTNVISGRHPDSSCGSNKKCGKAEPAETATELSCNLSESMKLNSVSESVLETKKFPTEMSGDVEAVDKDIICLMDVVESQAKCSESEEFRLRLETDSEEEEQTSTVEAGDKKYSGTFCSSESTTSTCEQTGLNSIEAPCGTVDYYIQRDPKLLTSYVVFSDIGPYMQNRCIKHERYQRWKMLIVNSPLRSGIRLIFQSLKCKLCSRHTSSKCLKSRSFKQKKSSRMTNKIVLRIGTETVKVFKCITTSS